jgi:osmotically-inducible protein OsmY
MMRPSGKIFNLTLWLCCFSGFSLVQAADDPTHSASASSQATTGADNSGINTRDSRGATLTPQDQSNQKEDRKVLAAVRRAVVQDKALSISAHNVKILVTDGVVTLRGLVNSEDEKSKLGQIATQVAGVASINNQLEVKRN